jgi:PAS domain S-box-containing protein
MNEKINFHDLLLENENLREKLHSLTQTEDELRESIVLFSRSEQIGNMGHWEWDEIKYRYITCSEQFANIHDMTVEQMMEKITSDDEDREFVCKEDRERYIQVVDAACESKQGWDIEYCHIDKEGKRVYLHEIGKPVLDDHGAITKTMGTVQDITEKKRVEEELKQSHALYRQAEAMGDMGHWSWDLVEDKLISCSDHFAQIYDMTVPEALDYFISSEAEIDLVHPDDKELFRQAEYDDGWDSEGCDFFGFFYDHVR